MIKILYQRIEFFLFVLPVFWVFSGHLVFKNGSKTLLIIMAILLLFFLVGKGWREITYNLRTRRFIWILWAYTVYCVFSKELHGYNNDAIRVVFSFSLYLTIVKEKYLKQLLDNIVWLFFSSAVITFSYVFYQMNILEVSSQARGLWPINPIPLTTVSAVSAISALYMLFNLNSDSWKMKVIPIGTIIFSLSAILMSETRSSLLAFLVASLIAVIIFIKSKKGGLKLTLVLIVSSLSILLLNFDSVSHRYNSTLDEISSIKEGNLDNSIGSRVQLWKTVIYTPVSLLGIGESHTEFRLHLKDKGLISGEVVYWDHYHNQFINTLIKYGLLGLFLLALLMLFPIISLYKMNSENKNIGFGVLLIFLITSITDIPYNQEVSLAVYLAVFMILLFPYKRVKNELEYI